MFMTSYEFEFLIQFVKIFLDKRDDYVFKTRTSTFDDSVLKNSISLTCIACINLRILFKF